jgi:hypothetical protein
MVMEYSAGLMEQNMKANGKTTKLMVVVSFTTLTETYSTENGNTIKPMALEHI